MDTHEEQLVGYSGPSDGHVHATKYDTWNACIVSHLA